MANVKSRPAGLQVKMARFQLQNPINPCSLPTACSHLLPGGVNSPGSHISSLRFVVFTAGGITADSWFCHKLIPHHYMSRSCLTWLFDFCQMIVYQTMTAICEKNTPPKWKVSEAQVKPRGLCCRYKAWTVSFSSTAKTVLSHIKRDSSNSSSSSSSRLLLKISSID